MEQTTKPMIMEQKDIRVLSIQSHVVHGYVGNKAAVFPLQLLGLEVDFINTVEFSNHTGYGKWTGERMSDAALTDLFKGLAMNNLDGAYDYVVTGYIGRADTLKSVLSAVQSLRNKNPSLKFFCDPVMGDNGNFYVPPECVEIYKNEILANADIITPNFFEMELLSGVSPLRNEDDVLRACSVIHDKGVAMVVMTGIKVDDDILIVGSCRPSASHNDSASPSASSGNSSFRIRIPRIDAHFTGTGDLFSALVLGAVARGVPLLSACERAIASLQAVLIRTMESGGGELRIVKSRGDIENPTIVHRAEEIKPEVRS